MIVKLVSDILHIRVTKLLKDIKPAECEDRNR